MITKVERIDMTTIRKKIEDENVEFIWKGKIGHEWVIAQEGNWSIALWVYNNDDTVYTIGLDHSVVINAKDDWDKIKNLILEKLEYYKKNMIYKFNPVDSLIKQVKNIN